MYHFHTRTKSGRVEQLNAAAPDVWIELSADDAADLGISEGDRVRVESERGGSRLGPGRRRSGPGVVFVPFHYGDWDPRADAVADGHRAANELTVTSWDPVSKQPMFKLAAVRVTKVGAERRRARPRADHRCRGPA